VISAEDIVLVLVGFRQSQYLPIYIYNLLKLLPSGELLNIKKVEQLGVAIFWVGYVCSAFLAFVAVDFVFSA
jgi:hypothetical protein